MTVRSACLGRRPDEGPRAIASAPSLCSSSVCGEEEEEGEAVATQTYREIKSCFEELAAVSTMCLGDALEEKGKWAESLRAG